MLSRKIIKRFLLLVSLGLLVSFVSGCWSEPVGHIYEKGLREEEDPGSKGDTNYQLMVSNFVTIEGTELLRVLDPDGDDKGDGTLRFPTSAIDGVFDIHEVVVSADSSNVYFYFAMQERNYGSPSQAAENVAGFRQLFLGVVFANAVTNDGNPKIQFYSPGDGKQDHLDTLVSIADTDMDYGIGMVGTTSNYGGYFFDAWETASPTASIRTVSNIAPGKVTRTSYDYLSGISTVFAFSVPRGTSLTSGTWKLFMFAYNWEDYGLTDCYPGNNGHLRENTGATPTGYSFGSTSGTFIRMADIVTDPANSDRQAEIFTSKQATASDMFSVVLP
jgi:hypothetical protein